MKVYYLDDFKNNDEYYSDFEKKAIYYLNKSEIIILPTDTIPGLSAIPFINSMRKIHLIKKRFFFKRYIFLFSNYESISSISNQIIPTQFYNFPIPITLIIHNLSYTSEGIAIRVPQRDYLKNILKKINNPIISTSVNLEGKNPLYLEKDIINFSMKYKEIKLVLIDRVNSPLSSTIIDIRNKPYKILRKGYGYDPKLFDQIC